MGPTWNMVAAGRSAHTVCSLTVISPVYANSSSRLKVYEHTPCSLMELIELSRRPLVNMA